MLNCFFIIWKPVSEKNRNHKTTRCVLNPDRIASATKLQFREDWPCMSAEGPDAVQLSPPSPIALRAHWRCGRSMWWQRSVEERGMGPEWWASQVSVDQSPPAPPPGAQQGSKAHPTLDLRKKFSRSIIWIVFFFPERSAKIINCLSIWMNVKHCVKKEINCCLQLLCRILRHPSVEMKYIFYNIIRECIHGFISL